MTEFVPEPIDQGKCQQEAWRLLQEAIFTGRMSLENGKTYTLDEDGMLKVAQWLAAKAAKTRNTVPLPESFLKKRKVTVSV